MLDITVAICTYNGAERIPEVLDKLKSQVDTETISWEIIVIDNNSKDNTAKVVEKYQQDWDKPYPLKYSFEGKQGLAFARRCAVNEGRGELICFLDDDNLPYPDWVIQAYRFGKSHPQAGAYGGQIHGKFELEPPPNFGRIARYFALIEGEKTYCYNEKYKDTPKKLFLPGAGIIIRKQAWLESIPEKPVITSFMALRGEDIEMCSHLWQKGWEIWFTPDLQIDHIIPKSRFQKDYILKFFRENGLCRHEVRMLAYSAWQRPFVTIAYMINDLLKIVSHFFKYRNILNEDLVARGEMELLINIFFSPFYSWKNNNV